jgi:hypothetical protein
MLFTESELQYVIAEELLKGYVNRFLLGSKNSLSLRGLKPMRHLA